MPEREEVEHRQYTYKQLALLFEALYRDAPPDLRDVLKVEAVIWHEIEDGIPLGHEDRHYMDIQVCPTT